MEHKKKISRKLGVVIAAAIVVPVSLIAYALLYFSNREINWFQEGKANIQISENSSKSDDMIEKELKWEKKTDNDTSYYICNKLVTVTSQYDDQNLRIMLIPSWWKEGKLVAGLADAKYTDFSYVKLNRSISETTLDVYTANDTLLLSYILNLQLFNNNWEIPEGDKISLDNFYLHYKGSEQLKKGTTSAPLITAVKIPENVYDAMYPDYELHIDVIADAIEKYGDAADNRNFN